MLSLVSGSLAFTAPLTPAVTQTRAHAPNMLKSQALPFVEAPKALDGSMVGDVGFDPLNLSDGLDLKFMREAELKHGRICMLAWLGYVVVDLGITAPGAPSVSSLAAHDTAVKEGAMYLLLMLVSGFEAISTPAVYEMMSGQSDRKPGDFQLDPFGWAKGDKAEKMMLSEVIHCRTAMLAFSGVVTQSALKEIGFPYF